MDSKERYSKLVTESEWLLGELEAIEAEIEKRCAGAGRLHTKACVAHPDRISIDSYRSSDYDPQVIYDEQFRETYINDRADRVRELHLRLEAEKKAETDYKKLTNSFVEVSRDIREEFEAGLLYVTLSSDDVYIFTIKHPDRSKLLEHAAFLWRLGFRIKKDEDGLVLLDRGSFRAVIPKALWDLYKERHSEINEFVCKFDKDAEAAFEARSSS